MRLGAYVHGSSTIHLLDPRVKIWGAVALSLAAFQAGTASCALLSAFLMAAAAASRIPAGAFLAALKPALPLLALLFLLHLVFTEGTPLVSIWDGFPAITKQGLHQGALVSWRFALLVATGGLLTMTTSPGELVAGLERLLRPLGALGVPSQEIAMMVSIALRFVPTLLEEISRVRDAQLSRCAGFGRGGLRRRASAAAGLILPVSLGALRRAEELATAMEARGYSGGPRTYLRELRTVGKDWTASLVIALALCSVWAVEILGSWP